MDGITEWKVKNAAGFIFEESNNVPAREYFLKGVRAYLLGSTGIEGMTTTQDFSFRRGYNAAGVGINTYRLADAKKAVFDVFDMMIGE